MRRRSSRPYLMFGAAVISDSIHSGRMKGTGRGLAVIWIGSIVAGLGFQSFQHFGFAGIVGVGTAAGLIVFGYNKFRAWLHRGLP